MNTRKFIRHGPRKKNLLSSLDSSQYKSFLGDGTINMARRKRTRNQKMADAYKGSLEFETPENKRRGKFLNSSIDITLNHTI